MVELPHLLSSASKDFQLPEPVLTKCQYWLEQVDLDQDYHSQILPISNFFTQLAENIRDPDWVWQQGALRMPSDFGVFGMAIALAETLQESLQLLTEFSAAAFPVSVSRSQDRRYVYFHVHFPQAFSPSLWLHVNYAVGGFSRFLQTYFDIGREQLAVAIPLSGGDLLAKHLQAMNPYYGANELTFRLRREYLDITNLRPDMSTKAELLSLCRLKVLARNNTRHFSDKVSALLQEDFTACLSMAQVADKLCMSARNLRKKLADENTTFTVLATGMKMRRACYLLEHTRENIDQVAVQTGYLDTAHFRKVFKQDQGMTPTQFRQVKAKEQPGG